MPEKCRWCVGPGECDAWPCSMAKEADKNGFFTPDLTVKELLKASHDTAKQKGWWEKERPFGDQVANFHGEVSEAWEEYRKFGLDPAKFLYFVDGKPEGIAAELADVFIRIADTCEHYGIDLTEAIRVKLEYNKTRPYRHGNKLA